MPSLSKTISYDGRHTACFARLFYPYINVDGYT